MATTAGEKYVLESAGGKFSPARPANANGQRSVTWRMVFLAVALAASSLYFVSWDRVKDSSARPATNETYILCSAEGEKSVYTVNDQNDVVECVAIANEFIVGSGRHDQLQGTPKWPVRRVPAGSIIVPGLSDSHCHIVEYGASRKIPLSEGRSVEDTVSLVASYIHNNPDVEGKETEIIVGWGWNHESWDGAQWPTASDFDANPTTKGRRIVLQSKDGHAIWVSTATLEANGPYPDTIEGGVIKRDEHGAPTGVFLDSAQELIFQPPISEKELIRRFRTAANDALAHGLTSLHDAGFNPESLEFFKKQVQRHGRLPLRVYGMTHFDENNYWGDQMKALTDAGGAGRLSARSVKIFADGALRTAGAALNEPYSDDLSTSGQMRLSAETLKTVIPRFMKDGWQVNVHAIGDRANGIVLDAFEVALREQGLTNASSLRPRLEHAQILTEADIRRIGRLGVIASIQPTHVISDMWFGEARLGPERVKGLYAFRSILSSGARITLGSDFPVEGINPLAGFYAALTRVSEDGRSPSGPGGWFPEQRLTRLEALRGMTIDPAYASFTEDVLGSLEPGKRADYVVLSRDIMNVRVEEILGTKVLLTAIDGAIVYSDDLA